MRRPVLLVVVGAVVLGLALSAALVLGVFLPRLRAVPDPDSRPTYAPGELTPEESTVVAKPQPDGTVRVSQTLVFDAGPGTDHPVTWYLGGTRVGYAADDSVRYGVVPRVLSVEALARTPEGGSVSLRVEVDESDYADPFDDGRRYALVAPRPWSPGRHLVEVSFVLADVWVEADGRRMLVLPLRFASGPDSGQPADLVRLTVNGAIRLECPDSDEAFAERAECGDGEVLNYRPAELGSVEAVTVPDPGFIDAAPVPITEQPR